MTLAGLFVCTHPKGKTMDTDDRYGQRIDDGFWLISLGDPADDEITLRDVAEIF